MSYGFVYLIVNRHMPHVYKIGCTERAPQNRCEELSRSTSVPDEFQVVCYIEVPDFKDEERRMHELFAADRVRPEREFFHWGQTDQAKALVIGAFAHNEERYAIAWGDHTLLLGSVFSVQQLSHYLDTGWPDPWHDGIVPGPCFRGFS